MVMERARSAGPAAALRARAAARRRRDIGFIVIGCMGARGRRGITDGMVRRRPRRLKSPLPTKVRATPTEVCPTQGCENLRGMELVRVARVADVPPGSVREVMVGQQP